jgi:hypothetical protein
MHQNQTMSTKITEIVMFYSCIWKCILPWRLTFGMEKILQVSYDLDGIDDAMAHAWTDAPFMIPQAI